ncbi:unnamed protein product [Ectocarpus sp. 4 AP-2014]
MSRNYWKNKKPPTRPKGLRPIQEREREKEQAEKVEEQLIQQRHRVEAAAARIGGPAVDGAFTIWSAVGVDPAEGRMMSSQGGRCCGPTRDEFLGLVLFAEQEKRLPQDSHKRERPTQPNLVQVVDELLLTART